MGGLVCEGHSHHCDGSGGVCVWDICFTGGHITV